MSEHTSLPRISHRRAIRLDEPLTVVRVMQAAHDDAHAREAAAWRAECERTIAELAESPGSSRIEGGRFWVLITSDARRWLIDGGYGVGRTRRGESALVIGVVCAALHDRSAQPNSTEAEAAMRLFMTRLEQSLVRRVTSLDVEARGPERDGA